MERKAREENSTISSSSKRSHPWKTFVFLSALGPQFPNSRAARTLDILSVHPPVLSFSSQPLFIIFMLQPNPKIRNINPKQSQVADSSQAPLTRMNSSVSPEPQQ